MGHHRTKVLVVRDIAFGVARVFVVDVDGLLFVVDPKNGACVPDCVQVAFHHVVNSEQGGCFVLLGTGGCVKVNHGFELPPTGVGSVGVLGVGNGWVTLGCRTSNSLKKLKLKKQQK